jgi:diadenosine tetraphosphate (Ap4A) HIT family hydrolase
MDTGRIFDTEHFTVTHCRDCSVPGYLIVSAKVPVPSLGDLTPALSADLGEALRRATQAVEAVIRPGRTYCARFGEETEALHFHLFPRTQTLLQDYQGSTGQHGGPCSGPQVFEWARRQYHLESGAPLSEECKRAIQALREWCAS